MKCRHCHGKLQSDDKFCTNCGAAVESGENEQQPLPAQQAEKIFNHTKLLVRHLSVEEKVIGAASLTAFVSFFLPWYANFAQVDNGLSLARFSSWQYLIPILLIVSLAIVYFSQGAKTSTKIYLSTIQSVIGMFVFTMVVTKLNVYTQFGAYLITLSALIISGYSLYFQKKVLLKS